MPICPVIIWEIIVQTIPFLSREFLLGLYPILIHSPLLYIYTYIFIYLYYIYIFLHIYIVSLVKCHWYSTKGRLPHQWVNTAVPPQGPMTGWHRRLKVHRTTGRRTSCDWRLAVGEAGKTWRIWSHFLWVWWWNDPKISWDITDYNPFLTKVSYIYIFTKTSRFLHFQL